MKGINVTGYAHLPAVERIARVLAGLDVSANGHGADASVADVVDGAWPDYRADAVAVLKTLREPDPALSQEDGVGWSRMIDMLLNADGGA